MSFQHSYSFHSEGHDFQSEEKSLSGDGLITSGLSSNLCFTASGKTTTNIKQIHVETNLSLHVKDTISIRTALHKGLKHRWNKWWHQYSVFACSKTCLLVLNVQSNLIMRQFTNDAVGHEWRSTKPTLPLKCPGNFKFKFIIKYFRDCTIDSMLNLRHYNDLHR